MSKNEIYRVEIPITVDDQTEAPLRQAEERVNRFEQQARKTNERIRRDFGRDIEASVSLIDKTWPVIRDVQSKLRNLTSRAWSVVVDVKDKVTGAIRGILSKAGRLLSHPLTLLGIGGGVAGATGAGLKMVMEEQDMVSAFQVMLGSQEAAEKRIQELVAFAGQTPYTRQEVWGASRQLEILTGGDLSTGDELTRIGDIAAGTVQPFEDVAMWIGQLYDGLKSGRPIGQAARRLQEMGALSGESRAKLERLAESGKDITKIWPEATKEFERFDGLMLTMSKNLKNILLGTKTFFTENVIKKWGQGVADALQPALTKFREWRTENPEVIAKMGEAIETFGRTIGVTFVGFVERAIERISNVMSDPEFEEATFAEKVRMLVEAGLEDVITWLKGPGKDKLEEAFKTIGEIAAKAFVGAMKTLGESAIEELKQGNVAGAAIPATAMWLGGGGAIARGAWGLGKGVWKAGKWAAGMFGGPATAQAAGVAGTGGAAAGATSISALGAAGVAGGIIGTAGVLSGAYDIYKSYKTRDKEEGRRMRWSGGTKIGMVGTGAAAGAAIGSVVPGVGTAVGGLIGAGIGGLGALLKGSAVGEALMGVWDDIAAKATEAWGSILETASSTWEWIQENISFEKLAEGVGFLLGYLEETLFSGEWWTERWEAVKDWATEKWSNMVEVWENTVDTLEETLFNSEWWLGRWEAVKDWTSEKWDGFKTVWENAKTAIKSTLFSEEWWSGQWETVKGWANNALSNIAERWEGFKESFKAGREAGQQAGAAGYATGGILTRPHLGLVAEAGPEAIIPLSARMRGRAMALWEETGKHLGVKPYAAGGFAGAPVAMPAAAGAGSGGSSVSVTNYIDVTVGGSSAEPDQIAGAIAAKIESVFQNMTK